MSDAPAPARDPVALSRRRAAGLGRRAMLQSLAAAVGSGLTLPFLSEAHPVHDHLRDQEKVGAADLKAAQPDFSPAFLDAHQLETLTLLGERMIPGSTEARVAPFLDGLLSISSHANQRRFVDSLGAFEMLAIDRHEKPWKGLAPREQDDLLTHASTAAAGPAEAPTIRNAFDDLRGWISGAYYSSEMGLRELGWTGEVIFAPFPGCEHPDGHP